MLRAWMAPALARFGWFVATLVGSLTFIQVLIALAPGDAIDLLPDSDHLREQLATEWGLDRPIPVRVLQSLLAALQGDLGVSLTYRPGADVLGLVVGAAGQSLALFVPALLLAMALAVGLAVRLPGATRIVQGISVVPAFLAAFLLVTAINAVTWTAIGNAWIDRPDWFALPDEPSVLRTVLAILVLATASGSLAEAHRATVVELERLRRSPFLDAARARGEALFPHLFANFVPFLLDLGATRVAATLASLVVVEKLLLFNGAGAMLWQACQKRDVPLAVGLTLAAAALVASLRLVADLARLALDPRLRT